LWEYWGVLFPFSTLEALASRSTLGFPERLDIPSSATYAGRQAHGKTRAW
jgi:hypothetical protein